MKITIAEAARILGVSEQCVRIGLQRGKFDFGTAFKGSGVKYKYVIYPEKLKEVVGADIVDNFYKNQEN